MVDDNAPAAPEDAPEDAEQSRDAKPWQDMIAGAEKVFDEWHKTCDNIAKDYASGARLKSGGDREFQMLYANLEVLKPSIYARAPQPVVVQRFKDSNRAVARKTGEMLERALIASFDGEQVHDTLKRVRDDLALTGRGQMWLRYETYPKGDGIKECVRYEWVHRRDFLHEPSRIWSENGWVARGTWLTKAKGEERFGEAWQNIAYVDSEDTADEYKIEKKARVWELWHKAKNLVVWVHPHAPEVLDIAPPHLSIEGFWPCPRPSYGTLEPDSLVPVPDASFYRDQLEEINELTARISALSESLRLVGFYASGAEDIGAAVELAIRQLNTGENRRVMVPLPGMSQMGGPAALRDAIVWLPVQEVAQTVKELVGLRRQLIDDVYQISGISDIMRGTTDAAETLGAQQLKSQYGSIRIRDRQGEMVRIADGALNIAGEIMAEVFAPQTLMEMSQIEDLPKQADVLAQHQQAMQQEIQQAISQAQQAVAQGQPPPDPQQIEQAKQQLIEKHKKEVAEVVTIEKVVGLLRNQKIRPFTLMIATDSTIQPDENAEKQARNEFSAAFAQTTNALAPLLAQAPEAADFAGEMLKFMLAPFRAGRQMEQAIDDFVEMMTKKSSEPRPPSPEAQKAEMEAKAIEQGMQAKAMELEDRKAERDAKMAQAAKALEAEGMKAEQDAMRQMQEADRKRQDEMIKRQQAMEDRTLKMQDEDRKNAEAARKAEHDAMMRQIDLMMARIAMDTERLKIISMAEQADEAKREKQEQQAQFEAKEYEREGRETSYRAEGEAKSSKRDEAMNAVLASLSQGLETVAQAQQALAESMSRPKTIKFNSEGRPVGIQ
jgi:hypothetical protein